MSEIIRTRRLRREYEKIVSELSGNGYVSVEPIQGDPPWYYRVTYRLPGLVWDESSRRAVVSQRHVVDIVLPIGYPRQGPRCTMRTPIWHPNIGDYVCIGDFWSPGVTLVDIIVHIADMIQYKSYNLASPVNKEAAVWARCNRKSFPVGSCSILLTSESAGNNEPEAQPATRESNDDIDISLGPVRHRRT
ncbi:MAG: ubiquitin-conjugating enzyme E2 [Armatimonadota bacterium]|nr:ubiquitin-conjugating enzyme E2 [Armatimonadota bacterium]